MHMRKVLGTISLFSVALALTGCGGAGGDSTDAPVPGSGETAADVSGSERGAKAPEQAGNAPPPAFAQCRSCHSSEPGKHMIGPSLAGIYGTRAGDIAGFNFSPALKESGLVWDDATLDAYIKAPRQMVPGTRMTYPGLKNDAQRAEVVAYLKSI